MHGLRLAVALIVLSISGRALAHPDIDEGRRLAQSAELERAMEAFDRAEASGALSHEDRIALYEGRALVYHALGDDAALSRTLGALAEIAPSHEMGRDIPPALRERFEAMRPPEETEQPAETVVAPAPADAAPDAPTPADAARDAPAPVDVARAASPPAEPAPRDPIDDREDGGGLGPWPFIGGAALVLAIGAAVAIYFLVPGSSTQPSFPRHPL